MSLAVDYLREYLSEPNTTQAEFARGCGMTAPNISDVLKGDVAISRRNVGKLLRGFPQNKRLHFLQAYLHDEIPEEYADDVTIQISSRRSRAQEECTLAEAVEAALVSAFRSLPSDTYRGRVLTLVRALRGDEKLRELLKLTVEYLQPPAAAEEEALGLVAEDQAPFAGPSPAVIAANAAAGVLASGQEHATPAPSPEPAHSAPARPPRAPKPRKAD